MQARIRRNWKSQQQNPDVILFKSYFVIHGGVYIKSFRGELQRHFRKMIYLHSLWIENLLAHCEQCSFGMHLHCHCRTLSSVSESMESNNLHKEISNCVLWGSASLTILRRCPSSLVVFIKIVIKFSFCGDECIQWYMCRLSNQSLSQHLTWQVSRSLCHCWCHRIVF